MHDKDTELQIYIFRGIYIHNIIRFLSSPTRIGYKIDNNDINIVYSKYEPCAYIKCIYFVFFFCITFIVSRYMYNVWLHRIA